MLINKKEERKGRENRETKAGEQGKKEEGEKRRGQKGRDAENRLECNGMAFTEPFTENGADAAHQPHFLPPRTSDSRTPSVS